MPNSERYHFSDFTRENYRRLLRLAKSKYTFSDFSNWKSQKSCVIWRHDCDASVHAAKALAKIEAEEGVSSIFFVLLNNEFYNLLERDVRNQIHQILEMGHDIGLHFDITAYKINSKNEFENWLKFEREIIERVFSTKIKAFSFHIPNSVSNQFIESDYSGMINVYSDEISKNFGYCSDSNGYWRHKRLEDVLLAAEFPRLQVLTHPEHWQDSVMSPRERIVRCIEGRAQKTLLDFESLLNEGRRLLVDWSEDERAKL